LIMDVNAKERMKRNLLILFTSYVIKFGPQELPNQWS